MVNTGGAVPLDRHPATLQLFRWFDYDHLPPHLQEFSRPFHSLAHALMALPDGPELSAGLRKLLEAKDCIVRAAIDFHERATL
jgi:hypothetical protein